MNVFATKAFKLSAIVLAVGLTACTSDDAGSLTCTDPLVPNDVGTECITPNDSDLITVSASQAVIYYKRDAGDYDGWGLHLWDDTNDEILTGTEWTAPMAPTGIHPLYGAYFVIDLTTENWQDFKFIVHNGDDKDIGGGDWTYSRADFGDDVFSFQGVAELFADPLVEIPVVVSGAFAHFLDIVEQDAASIVYKTRSSANAVRLWHSASASLNFDATTKTVSGGTEILMAAEDLSDAQKEAYPHLAEFDGYWVDATPEDAKQLVKGQLWVVETNADNEAVRLTTVQTAPLLDNLYYDNVKAETLGAFDDSGNTKFALWAPTATDVDVNVYDSNFALTETLQLTENTLTGVWSATATSDLTNQYYRYDIDVYHPITKAIENYEVTDPYSLSLSINSEYSQVVDLAAAELLPAGWAPFTSTAVTNPEDISVYETHVRDLSIWDTNKTDADQDGKFMAFTDTTRESMIHLQALRDAGMTAVQILPAFDIATIDEQPSARVDLSDTMADYCNISTAAADKAAELLLSCDATVIETALAGLDVSGGDIQDFHTYLRPADSFNWGYDPFHYTVPEGSYSTDPNGTARILEFREMVQALHDMDYMIIMDVVYNHTNASGVSAKSVLDKVVPGYYHRRDVDSGIVTKDSCCDDTATEHKMMAKLMKDSLVTWAEQYNVDAFRFDLMGLQSMAAMEEALVAVTEVNANMYFYGEGWDYGEAGTNGRGINASQSNIAGSGIGTFTDRLRDGIRGGGPFDTLGDEAGEDSLRRNQGLANSAVANELNLVTSVDPDASTTTSDNLTPDEELAANVLLNADIVRVGLAGNLKSFVFKNSADTLVNGTQVLYNDEPAAYADDPQEIINYVSKHDNQTLWDIIAYKAANTVSSADRARMQALSVATSAYAQGIPFFHMGVDLLRSKSMERDSYDSGDWFNKVDFASNVDSNWNVGLPREGNDGTNWDFIKSVIANVNSDPTVTDVDWMRSAFQEMLEIRSDSPLFRLTEADEVNARVSFHNTGTNQLPGVIAMALDDGINAGIDQDANYDAIMVIFNYTNSAQAVVVADASGFELHSVQQSSSDSVVQSASFDETTDPTFNVPALTTAVFVIPQVGAQGNGLAAGDVAPYGDTTLYVRGDITDATWTPVPEGLFAYQGAGDYEVWINAVAGDYVFKIADSDWTDGSNFGAGTVNTVTLSQALTLDGSGDINITIPSDGHYLFSVDTGISLTAPSLTVTADAPTLDDLLIRGDMNTWSDSANPLAYEGLGQYSATITLAVGSYAFKYANADWSTEFAYGTTQDAGSIVLTESSGNLLLDVSVAGDYLFTLDALNNVISVTLIP